MLRTGNEWQLLNVVDGQIQWQDMAWRQDSRLELLFETASNNASNTFIDQLETALRTCLIDRS